MINIQGLFNKGIMKLTQYLATEGYFCFKRPTRSYTFSSVLMPLFFDNEASMMDNPFSKPS